MTVKVNLAPSPITSVEMTDSLTESKIEITKDSAGYTFTCTSLQTGGAVVLVVLPFHVKELFDALTDLQAQEV